MRDEKVGFIIAFLLFAFFGALLSCTTDKIPLQIEKSLPHSELAYYNDSFDRMREDLWDRTGYIHRQEQMQNFKQSDLRFENGNLIIRTQTGSFSKGGLASRYALSGDFDIRLDFRMDFIKGISGMDQGFGFGVLDKSKKIVKMSLVNIGLSMKGGSDQGFLFSHCFINGKKKGGNSKKTENFNGTFRIQRTGITISTSYKKRGTPEWLKMNTFRATDADMFFGFEVRNHFPQRTTIDASHSVSAELHDFKINAAQEIIEEEI